MARPPAAGMDTATRDRILSAAEAEFGRKGFAAARLADVAREAGIRRPSLLYHFPSKDHLYAEVVHRAFSRLGDLLSQAISSPLPFASQLEGVVQGFLAFLDRQPAVAGLVLRELLDGQGPGRPLLLHEVAPLLDVMESFLHHGEGRPEGDRSMLRAAILQVVTGSMVRAASGLLREPLWGRTDHTPALVKALFLGGTALHPTLVASHTATQE